MLLNETESIHYTTLDKLAIILECPVGNLFEIVEDDIEEQ